MTRAARAVWLLVSLVFISVSGTASQSRSASPPIRRIDHIMIRAGEPRALFAFFSETLGSNTWQIGDGPAVRLVAAKQNQAQALVIRVASLERAKAFLRDKQLLGAEVAGQVSIDPSKVGGLDLRLVER